MNATRLSGDIVPPKTVAAWWRLADGAHVHFVDLCISAGSPVGERDGLMAAYRRRNGKQLVNRFHELCARVPSRSEAQTWRGLAEVNILRETAHLVGED